jgi:hypothetical protein
VPSRQLIRTLDIWRIGNLPGKLSKGMAEQGIGRAEKDENHRKPLEIFEGMHSRMAARD